MLNARVKVRNGLPVLLINGQQEVPHIFFLRADNPELDDLNREQVSCFAAQNLHLYTTGALIPFLPTDGKRDMSAVLHAIRMITDSDPEAKILLRVGLSPVGSDAVGDSGNGAVEYCGRYPGDRMVWKIERQPDHTSMVNNNNVAISLASDRWYKTACETLEELHRVLSSDPDCYDHLLGYHIGCGETNEWFYYGLRERGLDFSQANCAKYQSYLQKKYGRIERLEEAWYVAPGSYRDFSQIAIPEDLPYADRQKPAERTLFTESADARYRDYYDYSSELVSDRMTDIAHFARGLVGESKLLVFFYGYYFEVFDSLTGHFRLQKVLDNPDIDAFTSPISYNDRNHGGVGALMSPADSVIAHGKLWIVEDDIRTSNVVRQTARQAEWDWVPKVNSLENLREVQTREAGHMLAHGMGCWYMDLLGYGWHHHPMIWKHMGSLAELYRRAMPDLTALRPDVAVVVDEKAMSMATHAMAVGTKILSATRTAFYRSGVKFGFYTSEDYENGLADSARVVFYLDPFDISMERAKRLSARLAENHAALVTMHGFGRTPEEAVRLLTGMTVRTLSGSMMDLSCRTLSGVLAKDVDLLPRGKSKNNSGDAGLIVQDVVEQSANPSSYIEMDGHAQPIAVYEYGPLAGKIAVARSVHDGFSTVFVGPMTLSPSGIREICRLCGAPVYCETDDVFVAGNGVYMIHTNVDPGVRKLCLPGEGTLKLWGSNEIRTGSIFETDGRSTATSLWLDISAFPGV